MCIYWNPRPPPAYRKQTAHLDVAVEDGLGESLQRGALGHGEAGPLVEEGDPRRVSGQRGRVRVAEDVEVVVDGVADHHLPHEQPQNLLTERGEGGGD